MVNGICICVDITSAAFLYQGSWAGGTRKRTDCGGERRAADGCEIFSVAPRSDVCPFLFILYIP